MRWRRQPTAANAPEPIPYAPRDRKTDTRRGRRDGRKRIPSFTTLTEQLEAQARVSTPYQEELSHAGMYRINEQHRRFLTRITETRDEIARLRGALDTDLEMIERARTALTEKQAELTESELQPRNYQELPLTGTPVLHGRRAAMRDQRIAAARAELARCEAAADGRRQAITTATARIDHEFALVQAGARRLADYYVLRIASYWDAVVQTHPDGRNLSTALPIVSLTLPSWVDATCQDGVITLPAPAGMPPTEE
ncbi:hypothetical protein DMB66_18845 [Actinoplanes sp. ATCC 53533]|uniref:hypothetical protein n=1 Tax=Actinoplanes sp. ATCC 53533 TaxID=1288362 RepID=UPI000F7A8ABC|nr:hypothetical protein [Actinoplanes sp. ATCC 53533]RSM64706.1 hypothetical protein DMB66_18845 [Actinoplanes sp. ATCC 53533]